MYDIIYNFIIHIACTECIGDYNNRCWRNRIYTGIW